MNSVTVRENDVPVSIRNNIFMVSDFKDDNLNVSSINKEDSNSHKI